MILHIEEDNILYHCQFGFRKGFSTGDAVANLVSEALTGFGNNQMLLSVFIDLKKAFDMISHGLILKKLEMLGVRDTELEWFKTTYQVEPNKLTSIMNTLV